MTEKDITNSLTDKKYFYQIIEQTRECQSERDKDYDHLPQSCAGILIQFIILQIMHACEEYSHSVSKDKLKLQYFILNACLIAAKDKINLIQNCFCFLSAESRRGLLNCYLVTNHRENGILPN